MPSGELLATRLAFDLRDTWQARTLTYATGRCGAVLLSVLAHNFDECMEVLLTVCFPGFKSIDAPFLSSAGRVQKNGAITADVIEKTGSITKQAVLYRNETELRDEFRRLADELKLNDDDRKGLFAAVQNWLVCDYRLDPSMNPADPDAKRLVH